MKPRKFIFLIIIISFFIFIYQTKILAVDANGDIQLIQEDTQGILKIADTVSIFSKQKVKQNALPFTNGPDINILGLFFRMLFILAGVLLFFYILKKIFGKKKFITSDSGILQILGTLPISPNKSLYIVELAEEIYVLGVTDHNINLITKISDQEKIDSIKMYSDMSAAEAGSKGFMDLMIGAISKKKKTTLDEFKKIEDFK